jgi:hypothetical protein
VETLLKLLISLGALWLATYLYTEGRLPFWMAAQGVVTVGRRRMALVCYPYRPQRTYWRLEVSCV